MGQILASNQHFGLTAVAERILLACQIADFQINYISRKNDEVASFFAFWYKFLEIKS